MYRAVFLILFAFFVYTSVYCQEREFHQIEGKIINTRYNPLPFAHILIKNKRMGKVGNSDGSFIIIAEAGDTIIFSSVGYKNGLFIVPKNEPKKILNYIQIMITDTIELKEAIIFPWDTYEEFKKDFIEMEMVNDDIERAYKNLALIEKQMIMYADELPAAQNASYRVFMDENVYNKQYYAGQSQPIQILNVMAWSEFFKALKNGDFKWKKYD